MAVMQMMQKTIEIMQANNRPEKFKRCNQNLCKYCWTHGLYNSTSPEYHTPADSHKNEATLQNCMGGSVKDTTRKIGPDNISNVDYKIERN